MTCMSKDVKFHKDVESEKGTIIAGLWSLLDSVATARLKTMSRPCRAENEASHSHSYGWVAKAMKPRLELWLGPKMETLARKQHPGSSSHCRHLL